MELQTQMAAIRMELEDGVLSVHLSGPWKTDCDIPDLDAIAEPLKSGDGIRKMVARTEEIASWDSMLMTFLVQLLSLCERHDVEFERSSLPNDLQRLLNLSLAVPEKEEARRDDEADFYLARIGKGAVEFYEQTLEILTFSGECTLSVLRLVVGRTSIRWRDFWLTIQEVGANAIAIVTLISFLVGLIIAFLGAVVLSRFGADVYVSYLVAYGMLRELGALMTGIIIAGRTGAAFAAEIGSMKVSEEIDALKTLGISPIDFIVLPRMLALFLMMPVLVIYADVIGVTSGMLISKVMLDIPFPIFLSGVKVAADWPDYVLGVVKGIVFGVLIAVSGCLRGMQSGSSADAVGLATTSAVVTGITLIIFFNAVIDWIAAIYGI